MDIMQHGRIVDILVVLMGEIKTRGMGNERMELLSTELLKRGYSEQEISTAFSWILERIAYSYGETSPGPNSFRVLHDIEKIFISREAYGFLLHLMSVEMISAEEFERIVERVLMEAIPGMGVDKIKDITTEVLFGASNFGASGGEIYTAEDYLQ